MQSMHNNHPSNRHDKRSGSMQHLYDNDQQSNQFNASSPHPMNQHHYQQSSHSRGTSRNYYSQQSNTNNNNLSSSFTEAHSNNLNNLPMQSMRSSQSIPSPMNQRTKSNRSTSSTSSQPIRPSSHAQHSTRSTKYSTLKHPSKSLPNNNNPSSTVNDPSLFSLHGILRIMKQQDPNYQMVTLGMDLTQLGGLDLNCPEPEIHHTFLSPWLDKWDDSNKFITPQCYKLKHNEHPPIKFIKRYKESTLFYIFYSMVNDKMQVIAAKELYIRNWVYHKGFKLWLRKIIKKKDKNSKDGMDEHKINKEEHKDDKTKKTDNKDDDLNKNNLMTKNLNDDKAILFMKNVSVEHIEYFDVETWKTKHFYSKFPIDWNQEKKRLLYEHQLNYFYKACQDSYTKNRHQH